MSYFRSKWNPPSGSESSTGPSFHPSRESTTPVEAAAPPARILLVEDNKASQLVALAILEKLGCRADLATNGEEALALARNVIYDLVLMDCQMPVMNGYEAARRIRDSHSGVLTPHVPIIALTAHAMNGEMQRCVAAGMNDYISKPVEPATLAAAITKWLRHATAPQVGAHMAPNQTPPVFNESALVERLMGDREFAQTILATFTDDMAGQLAALHSHLTSGDTGAALLVAHTIKGAAATVGAEALSRFAAQLERTGNAGDLPAVAANFPELQRHFFAAKEAIIAVRLTSGTPA